MIGCLALYDFDVTQFKLKDWVEWGESWMTANDYAPNTMGLPHSGKFLRYNNGKKKLEKENYSSSNLDFYAGGEAGTDYVWKMAAYFADDDRTTYLCFDEEIISFNYEILEQLLIDLSKFCSPQYGIGFLREKKYGPDPYALGYSHGLKYAYQNEEHGKENDRIHCWMKSYVRKSRTYKTGDLRDIYPFNVLSPPHLDRIVNGSRFQDWVQASSERGQLRQISDHLWTWWVGADKIPAVREALAPSGMILCL